MVVFEELFHASRTGSNKAHQRDIELKEDKSAKSDTDPKSNLLETGFVPDFKSSNGTAKGNHLQTNDRAKDSHRCRIEAGSGNENPYSVVNESHREIDTGEIRCSVGDNLNVVVNRYSRDIPEHEHSKNTKLPPIRHPHLPENHPFHR